MQNKTDESAIKQLVAGHAFTRFPARGENMGGTFGERDLLLAKPPPPVMRSLSAHRWLATAGTPSGPSAGPRRLPGVWQAWKGAPSSVFDQPSLLLFRRPPRTTDSFFPLFAKKPI